MLHILYICVIIIIEVTKNPQEIAWKGDKMLNEAFNKIDIQKRALDASWLRQSVIANNIANVNTPGYKRQDVEFEAMLQDYLAGRRASMTATHASHFDAKAQMAGSLQPVITTDRSTSFRIDGNNVNIDVEMANQAQNTIKYNALTTQVNSQISRLKAAIKGGV